MAHLVLKSIACAAALLLARPAFSAEDANWSNAEEAYDKQNFASALARFEHLATAGDLRAAERSELMLLFGEALYGKQVPRDAQRAAVWLARAAKDGSEVAARLLPPALAPHDAAEDEPYVLGAHGC